jgi:hypothetical protein
VGGGQLFYGHSKNLFKFVKVTAAPLYFLVRLIIIEDDEKTSGALQSGLEQEGFFVATAKTGETG